MYEQWDVYNMEGVYDMEGDTKWSNKLLDEQDDKDTYIYMWQFIL